MSGNFINGIQVCIEGLLCFSRRDVSDGALEALGVVPADPFQCFPFDLADRFPRAEEFDDFGFDQADDAFGQGIVLAAIIHEASVFGAGSLFPGPPVSEE